MLSGDFLAFSCDQSCGLMHARRRSGSAGSGVVRIMHPDKGMGIEFTQATPEHRAIVEKFVGVLNENRTLLPELLVEPEGLESEPKTAQSPFASTDDPLLQLFYGERLTAEAFHEAMRKQRAAPTAVAASVSASGQR